jgi:peptidyl-prolyl cis-trans isomerase D
MLQAIRTRAGSLIVKILFAFLILTFSLWGIGDIFRNRSQDTTVATVGNREIRIEDMQTALQTALETLRARTGQSIDLQQAKQFGLVQRVLDELVDQSLLDQEAARLGLDMPDSVIRNAIYNNPGFMGPGGRFDRARFDAMLAQSRMTEGQFVEEMRRSLSRGQILDSVTTAARAPGAVVDALYRYREQKRVADVVSLPLAKAPDPGQPGAEALDKFYQAHRDMFRAPEYRTITVASLTPSDIAATIKIPPQKLQDAYKDQEDDLRTPEKRQVEQILAPSQAKAKEAETALAAGRDWKEVATTIAGQKPDTIDLGLVEESQLPPPLGSTAFALQPNTPSRPVKSMLGWHILRVVKIIPAATESFEQAKPKLIEKLTRDAALDRIYDIGNHVDDALAGGAGLDATAAKFGLKLTKVAAADESGNGPDGKPVALPLAPQEVVKLAFATDQGRTSRVIDTEDSGLYVVRVDGVTPPRVRSLAEVKDQAVKEWQDEQRRQAVATAAAALKAAVAPGTKLAAAAAAKGLTATTTKPFQRQAQPGTDLPPALVARLFAAKPGDVVTSEDQQGFYVAQLDKVDTPQTVAAADTEGLSQALTQSSRADLEIELTDALKQRFPYKPHLDVLDKAF